MQLNAHESAVNSVAFSPCRQFIASGGFDRQIFVWKLWEEGGEPFALAPKLVGSALKGHKNAILKVIWPKGEDSESENTLMFSCGAQRGNNLRGEILQWDLHKFERVRHYEGHKAIVNSIDFCSGSTCSASDDSSVKLWDARMKHAAMSFEFEGVA
mmetsp:Transcript_7443/g.12576  ORF Transcript_7443/g.12576 Transcript_7443/m.12576 type:complete len:156 (+) Transcript_7443:109-576(+)